MQTTKHDNKACQYLSHCMTDKVGNNQFVLNKITEMIDKITTRILITHQLESIINVFVLIKEQVYLILFSMTK